MVMIMGSSIYTNVHTFIPFFTFTIMRYITTLLLHVLLTSLLHRVDTNYVFIQLFREEDTSINLKKKKKKS